MSLLQTIKNIFGGKPSGQTTPVKIPPPPPPVKADIYLTALNAERKQKDFFFKTNAYSPIDINERQNFPGLNYFPPDETFQFTLTLTPQPREPLTIQTNTGDPQPFFRVGYVTFTLGDEEAQLYIYQSENNEGYFAPFRDATSGKETYGAGRYLEPDYMGNDQFSVDFNLAYNPYCAYAENFVCPVPPRENWLSVAITAGEKAFHAPDDH